VHLIRPSLDCAHWNERKPMATALGPIDAAPTVAIIPVFAFPPDLRA